MRKDIIIIPARRGSKRIVGKNTVKLGHKPLIQHTLDFVREKISMSDVDVFVTSDDPEVLRLANDYKFHVIKREPLLAGDTATTVDVCVDLLERFTQDQVKQYDLLHLFQPTAPFREIDHFHKVRRLFDENKKLISAFSVAEEDSCHPAYMYFSGDHPETVQPVLGNKFKIGVRAQDMPKVYRRDGSYYSIKLASFLKSKSFLPDLDCAKVVIVPGQNAINIDTQKDLDYAEYLIRNRVV